MKHFLLTLVLFSVATLAMAQSPNILDPAYQNSRPNPCTFGGNIGFSYSYGLGVDISPRVGYKTTDDLELAAMVNGSLQLSEYFLSLSVSVVHALSY